jgi:hypothetical protein
MRAWEFNSAGKALQVALYQATQRTAFLVRIQPVFLSHRDFGSLWLRLTVMSKPDRVPWLIRSRLSDMMRCVRGWAWLGCRALRSARHG